MRRICTLIAIASVLFAARSAALDFGKLDRRIAKEPVYQSKPLYGLALVGLDAKTQVWMVLDGERLYIDKNCNGDLTDDGPPAEIPDKVKDISIASFEEINVSPDGGQTVYKFEITLWERPSIKGPKGIELQPFTQSVHVTFPDGRLFGAWGDHIAPLNFAASSREAPVMRFGGALRMGFEIREPMQRVEDGFKLSACVGTPGSRPGAWVHLLYKTIPKDVHPKVVMELPPEKAGEKAVRVQFTLDERC